MKTNCFNFFCVASLFLIGYSGTSCLAQTQASQRFTVKGSIEGVASGKLLLLSITGEQDADTLDTFTFNSPEFELSGTANKPLLGKIVLEGFSGGFEFLAEPGSAYTATLANGSQNPIRGGKLQNALNAYSQKMAKDQKTLQNLRHTFDSLRTANKYRSASKVNDSIQLFSQESQKRQNAFIRQNDNLLSAYLMLSLIYKQDLPLDETKQVYAQLGTQGKQSAAGQIIAQRIARMEGATAGRTAPDFTLQTPEGKEVTLSQVKAKVKIVDFWASWCGPCRLNNPSLKKLYESFKEKGLEIVGVSLDNSKKNWVGAIDKDGLPWIQVSSLKGWKCATAQAYSISAIPALFVLDSENRIIAKDIKGEALWNFISDYLK